MTLAGYNLQDNVYIYSNNKCMCVFLISPVPIAEPLTSELIDTPVFYNLAPRPIKYRVSVPIPNEELIILISGSSATGYNSFNNLVGTGSNKHVVIKSLLLNCEGIFRSGDIIIIIIINFICGHLSRHSRTPYKNKIHN